MKKAPPVSSFCIRILRSEFLWPNAIPQRERQAALECFVTLRNRQRERKRCPLADRALRPHPPALREHELFHDREAEAGAAGVPRARGVDAVEAVEQVREGGGGDAGALD